MRPLEIKKEKDDEVTIIEELLLETFLGNLLKCLNEVQVTVKEKKSSFEDSLYNINRHINFFHKQLNKIGEYGELT